MLSSQGHVGFNFSIYEWVCVLWSHLRADIHALRPSSERLFRMKELVQGKKAAGTKFSLPCVTHACFANS
jgi:hypothetical protein